MTGSVAVVRLRQAAALVAAAVGIAICKIQNHVHIALAHPSTYTSPLHHKCGLLMLGCVSWAICEIFLRA
jgi:hypothetical protein